VRAWSWFLCGGLVCVAVDEVLPVSVGEDLLYTAVGFAAAAAILVGVRRNRPVTRTPWLLFATGILLWSLGDVVWTIVTLMGSEPFPSAADAFYLLGYGAFAVGLHHLARSRNPGGDRTGMIDALMVGVAVGLAVTVFLVEPGWAAGGSALARSVGVAYPVADVILLIQLTNLRTAGHGRTPALRLLNLALIATLIADLLFQSAPGISWLAPNTRLLDGAWLIGYLLFGAAALHPSMAAATDRQSQGVKVASLTRGQLLLISGSITVVPVTLLVEVLSGTEPRPIETVAASIIIIWLVYLRMVGMTTQMTKQREHLARLAEADVLTGLPNRRRFTDTVTARMADGATGTVPVLLIVLDRFTEINDTLGHRVGDELLCAVAARMTKVVGAHGLVARLGGDSFGVVMQDESHCREEALGCATTLRGELAAPFELSDVTVSIDPLIGVAVGPGDGTDAEELLQRADVAVSVARERPGRVARYTGRMPSDGALTPHLLTELGAALQAGDVVVHYQPQVQVATGRVIGVEALVRWQHPVHGLLPPASFIPAAERTGLIRPLTLYVLNRALDQAAQWRAAGRDLSVAVNLSVRDLLDPQFVADVRDAVLLHGVGGQGLELEITETMAMVDPQRSLAVLEALSAMGVMLSVDDYGTGYSSLAYLQRLPVRRLKIDRSFVMGMVEDEASAAIVRSTIELARNLGMTVVAEGVEDDATLLALRAMGCDTAQGFGLGRPVPGADVLDLVATIEHRVPRVLDQRVPIGRRMV